MTYHWFIKICSNTDMEKQVLRVPVFALTSLLHPTKQKLTAWIPS